MRFSQSQSQSIDDLIQLRKLRKSAAQQGINLEKLNRGESKKERAEEVRFGLFANGLQKGKGKEEVLYVLFSPISLLGLYCLASCSR